MTNLWINDASILFDKSTSLIIPDTSFDFNRKLNANFDLVCIIPSYRLSCSNKTQRLSFHGSHDSNNSISR